MRIREVHVFPLLIMVFLCGCALSFVLYSGPFYSYDDANYINLAHQMLTGGFSLYESTYSYSYLFLATIAISFKLFGINVIASFAPEFFEYLLMVGFAFLIGREIKGEGFGLLTAFITATSPYIVGYATRVLPDMLTGLLAAISLYLFLAAGSSKRKNLLYFGSGAFAMLTIYSKLIGIAFVIALVVATLFLVFIEYKKKERKSVLVGRNGLIYMISGMLTFFLLYLLISYIFTSNPLYTLTGYSNFNASATGSTFSINLGYFTINFFIWIFGPIFPSTAPLNAEVYLFGSLLVFSMLGTSIAFSKKDKTFMFTAVLLWAYILYLYFGTVSISSYAPIYVVARYFIEIALPLSILVSYFIYSTYSIVALFFRTSRTVPFLSVILVVAYVLYANIGPYQLLYSYNTAVNRDTDALLSVISYINTNSLNWNHHLYISENNGDSAEFMSFLSKYNSSYNITTAQGQCSSSYNSSLYLAFYNSGAIAKNATANELAEWPNGACSLVALKSFSAGNSTNYWVNYWGFLINSTLYYVR